MQKGGVAAMPVMDEFKEEREALKHGTLKQKFSYFMDYYKWHAIITVLVLIAVISFIVQTVTRKEVALYVCMLNTMTQDAEGYAAGFAEFADIDLGSYDLTFDTSMHIREGELDETTIVASQKLIVHIAAGELDVMVTDAGTIKNYTVNDYFYDLREFLTPEQAKRCEPYFYYVDMKVVREWQEALTNLDESYVPSYPDPRRPEEMEEPVPVGLCLDDSVYLKRSFYFLDSDVVLAVFQNTSRPETVRQFINYVMAEP